MGRRGLLQAFIPVRQRNSHPWRTPPPPPAAASDLSKQKGNKKNNDVVKINKTYTSLKAFQPQEEELSLDCSIHYSTLFPSQRNLVENETEATANTSTDAMSSMSQEALRQGSGVKRVQFDFDPALVLDQSKPLHEGIQSNLGRGDSIPTDLEVVHNTSHYSSRNHQADSPFRVKYVEENHNQYIARKFNRTRIEFYLDLLCPRDDISEEDSYPEQLPHEEIAPVLSLPHLPNQGPEMDVNRTRSSSNGGESNSKQTKSFDGFSLEAAEFDISKRKFMLESSGNDFTDQRHLDGEKIKDDNNDYIARLDFIIQTNMRQKIPSSIQINFENDTDEEITVDGDSEIDGGGFIKLGDTTELGNHVSDPQQTMEMIQASNTYNTTNSPTGVQHFDFKDSQIQGDPKMLGRITSPTGVTSANHKQYYATPYTKLEKDDAQPQHYYQPMSNSKKRPHLTKPHNSARMIYKSQEKVDHLRSRLEKMSKFSSSPAITSVKTFASPVTYNSANIAKIKSKMRRIESQYNQIKAYTVNAS